MPSTEKPVFFRAVHAKTRWRKARHETLANARSVGSRSARALFRRENDVIDYRKHGEPRYVIIWDKRDSSSGEILKPDTSSPQGFLSKPVSLDVICRWESVGEVSDEELEQYFRVQRQSGSESNEHQETAKQTFIPQSAEQLEAALQAAIQDSRTSSQEQRLGRLASANPKPRRIQVQTSAFLRSADVIVEVLERANGQCEICKKDAPFMRASDGSPYLEVHHIIPLSCGGYDTVANAQALCPNCHRRLHFGADAT